jgi:hypothetical protein
VVTADELESSLVVESSVEAESSVDVAVEVESALVVELGVVEMTAACWLVDEELVVPIDPS